MSDFRVMPARDIGWALQQVLQPATGGTASPSAVRAFKSYLETTGSVATASEIKTPDGETTVLTAILPGRLGMVLISPGRDSTSTATSDGVRQAIRDAMPELVYLQALVDVADSRRRQLLQAVGFTPLTTLIYLERGVTFPWVEEPDATIVWDDWSDATQARFHSAIAASYVGSHDCPELTGLRTMEEIVAAHRAAGVFHPDFWQLARKDGLDLGLVLLAEVPLTRSVELVYLGVSPEARRTGVGRALMRRAFELARRHRSRTMTVVVDERNAAARRLYESLAFHEVARRDALWIRNTALRAC